MIKLYDYCKMYQGKAVQIGSTVFFFALGICIAYEEEGQLVVCQNEWQESDYKRIIEYHLNHFNIEKKERVPYIDFITSLNSILLKHNFTSLCHCNNLSSE